MSKKPTSAKKEQESAICPVMKALDQSLAINSFQTNFKFSSDLGMELLKGSATDEHILVLKRSLEGLKEYIELVESKIKERKST